jgi:glucose-1-phosphate thymidylyltransferase
VNTTAIIPAAGIGTRLRPHTYTLPKALIPVAGKPMLAHILDDLAHLGVSEAVVIVGYKGERVREFVTAHYPHLRVEFVEQPEMLGLGHAVGLAEPFVAQDEPVLIVLGDTIFRADLSSVLSTKRNMIGVKSVEDPRRFGVAVLNGGGTIERFVEKPDTPISHLAIVGIYSIVDSRALFECIHDLVRLDIRTKGEYQLTDALERMLERGCRMEIFPVDGWYDCGKRETLLETNRDLLAQRGETVSIPGSVIHPPVYIDPTARVENCVIGPSVTLAAGVIARDAVIRDSIVAANARVEEVLLDSSLIGENAVISGSFHSVDLGDSSEVRLL